MGDGRLKKPCEECDDNYPMESGALMGRDELWENGWHTHKREGMLRGHEVFKGAVGEALSKSRTSRFPWEPGYSDIWDEEGHMRENINISQ